MKCGISLNNALIHNVLILLVLSSQVGPGASRAYGDTYDLQEQPPIMDHTPVQSPILKGRVHRDDAGQTKADDSDQSTKLNAGVTEHSDIVQSSNAQPQSASTDAKAPPDENLQKLSGAHSGSAHSGKLKGKMTSEDYRNLEYGILGMVTEKHFFGSKQTITEVYPGCPAALAGIEPGDVEVQTDDHVWNRGDDQRSNWNIADGKAGTPVDVIIKRHRQLITFHLIRMNIEDIQNDRIRRTFERLLRNLGPPRGDLSASH